MEKLKVIFESELNSNRSGYQIPIFARELVTSHTEIYKYLFEQFRLAPLVPSFQLYLKSKRSEYDIDRLNQEHQEIERERPKDGIARFYSHTPYERTTRELYMEFNDLTIESKLPSNCFVNDLHQTPFIVACKQLETLYGEMEERALMPAYLNEIDQTKVLADKAAKVLGAIDDNVVRSRLIGWLTTNNKNIKITVNAALDQTYQAREFKEDQRTWSKFKDNFNAHLLKILPIEPINIDNLSNNTFSVLKWATIFYYADKALLVPGGKTKKERIMTFMKIHNINTSPANFKNNYYEVERRIITKKDYPIKFIHDILPFVTSHYRHAVTDVMNDIYYLENEQTDT